MTGFNHDVVLYTHLIEQFHRRPEFLGAQLAKVVLNCLVADKGSRVIEPQVVMNADEGDGI